MSQPSILDARLAEIDRRLLTIQSGLVPETDPSASGATLPERPPPPPPARPRRAPLRTPQGALLREVPPPALPTPSQLIAELRELTVAHERLLASTRELLASYAAALGLVSGAEGTRRPAGAAAELSVSAGPFTGTAALRDFERALGRLPEVREVAVRGYEGDDRAIVDVHLFEPTS